MQQSTTARAFLQRLHPWLGKAVHARWGLHRSFYQREINELLLGLNGHRGRIPPDLNLRLEGFLGRLYREWFPRTWRRDPTYAEIVADFRWWLNMAERWGEARAKPAPARPGKREPVADQPKRLIRLLGLPLTCTETQFVTAWRRFLKRHHPDLNPDQTPEERRQFAEAVALWRR
jgi:hypothetical protein